MSCAQECVICVVSFIFNNSRKLSIIFPISQMKHQKFVDTLPKIPQLFNQQQIFV